VEDRDWNGIRGVTCAMRGPYSVTIAIIAYTLSFAIFGLLLVLLLLMSRTSLFSRELNRRGGFDREALER
jgi:hypothetical protein